jgi:hypothetical protein
MAIQVEEHCLCGQSLTGTFSHLTQEQVDLIITAWWDIHTGSGHGRA